MANPYYPPRDPRKLNQQASGSNPFARQPDQQGSAGSGYSYGAAQSPVSPSHAYPPVQNQRPMPSHQGQYAQPTPGRNPYSQQYADPFATTGGAASTNPYYAHPQPYHGGESALHLAPPQPSFATGTARGPSGELIQRPESPFDGVYEDRPPNIEKLNPAQKKIAAQFPKDLDKEGSSMLQSMKDMAKDWRKFVKWKYTHYYIILIVVLALVALMTIYHRQIIDWLTPLSKKIRSVSWGWVIPVAILFVVSFPPLAGAEIVIILLGVVYGLWIGFAIASLGTLLGELANFYAFKFCLRRTAEKYERKNLNYACMAHIVREGGFMVVLLARLSAIPGHFTTAVFATVGMNVFIFIAAALLSMPKQLSVVYLGVAIEQSGTGAESTTSKIVKYVVLFISFIVTVWAAWYLYDKMEKARPIVQSRLRARRYTMLSEARAFSEHGGGGEPKSPDKDLDGDYDEETMYSRGGQQDMPLRKLGVNGAGPTNDAGNGRKWSRWSGNGLQQDEEARREGQAILRSAAPLGSDPRTKSTESFDSSDQSHTTHEQDMPAVRVQHYEEPSDASFNPGRGLPRRDVTELDIDVLQSAVAPRASQLLPSPQQQQQQQAQQPQYSGSPQQQQYSGPPPQYRSPTSYEALSPPLAHAQARPQARQDSRPPPVANSNNRRSYRYATDVGSIYDMPGSTAGAEAEPESAAQMYLSSSVNPPRKTTGLHDDAYAPQSHVTPTRWSQVDGPSAV